MKENQQALELFKRAITSSVRALAKNSNLEISFDSKQQDAENHKTISLPVLSRELPFEEITDIRASTSTTTQLLRMRTSLPNETRSDDLKGMK